MSSKIKYLVLFLILVSLSVSVVYAQDESGTSEDGGDTPPAEDTTTEPAPTEPEPQLVEEPVVEEPAPEEPTGEEPVVEEPVVDEPTMEEPIEEPLLVDEPVVEEPSTEEPIVQEPTTIEPMPEPHDDGACYVGDERVPCPGDHVMHDLPPGCWEVIDDMGNIHVKCEEPTEPIECPQFDEDAKQRCIREGGEPNIRRDDRGCEFIECIYGGTGGGGFGAPVECPSIEELERVSQKCEDMGMKSMITEENGCKFVHCIGEEEPRPFCDREADVEIKEKCIANGGRPVKDFDPQGCPITVCMGDIHDMGDFRREEPDRFIEHCKKEVPREAFEYCEEDGGEFVVKRDDRGCIHFAECVRRGDERDIEYEAIERIPEASNLLSVALKLESLKIEFDRLAIRTNDIAEYYASTGDEVNERKFRTVSGMFEGAKDRVDEIKLKLRDRLDYITKEDLMEVRHDIKYIKDVIIKDILYVMLSSEVDDEFQREIATGEVIDCGRDDRCWERSLRTCSMATINPEMGITAEITGLEGRNCVFTATMTDDTGTYDMVCKYPNYAFGKANPEDFIKFCEGTMVDKMKEQFQQAGMGGPGGCMSDFECEMYCSTHMEECMRWCDENPDVCPEGPRQSGGREIIREPREPDTEISSCWCEDNGECETFECNSCLDCGGPGCVCNDNGICTGEECPECMDCVEKTGEFVMCSPEDEKAWDVCSGKGGMPQSDPSTFDGVSKESCKLYGEGCCEKYTGCQMPTEFNFEFERSGRIKEIRPTVCAAKIKLTLDKEIYYYGDDYKSVVEIFDSEGNHIPSYSFYSRIYTYHDGLWHTPSEYKTDQDGYHVEAGIIEEGRQALGKVKSRVYTSDTGAYAGCDSVEDIVEAEIKERGGEVTEDVTREIVENPGGFIIKKIGGMIK